MAIRLMEFLQEHLLDGNGDIFMSLFLFFALLASGVPA